MEARFESSDALDRFVTEVRRQLDASGFAAAASRLASVQGAAVSTGSEWLGELGMAVNAIRKDGRLPPEIRDKLEVIRAEVRRSGPRCDSGARSIDDVEAVARCQHAVRGA